VASPRCWRRRGPSTLGAADTDLRAGPLSWRLVLADAAGHVASRAADPLPGGERADPYAATDPTDGRVVSANAAPDPAAPSAWPGAFEAPDRATRISELLDSTTRHSAETFRRIQLDTTSLRARRALAPILDDLAGDPTLTPLRSALASWDARCERESAGCAAFELLVEALPREVFADELGAERWARFAAVGDLAARAATHLLEAPGSPWWDDVTTARHETREDRVRRAAHEALVQLTGEGGDEPEGWNWGAFHVIRLASPLAAVPLIGHHFERGPFAHPGDRYTVNAAGFARSAGVIERAVKLGPTSRFVIDLASPERGYFACSTGMSEDPFSGYAWNLTDSWLAGELFVESLDGPRDVHATVILTPAPGAGATRAPR
jgi:penicillin amidase